MEMRCPSCGKVLEKVNVVKHASFEGTYDKNDNLVIDATTAFPNSKWMEVFCPECGEVVETIYLD